MTSAPRGVGGWQLSDDGASLWYVTTRDREGEDEFAALRATHGALSYGHGTGNLSQLVRLDLSTWRGEAVVDEGRVIGAFAASPDGARVAMITTPDEEYSSGPVATVPQSYRSISLGEPAVSPNSDWPHSSMDSGLHSTGQAQSTSMQSTSPSKSLSPLPGRRGILARPGSLLRRWSRCPCLSCSEPSPSCCC